MEQGKVQSAFVLVGIVIFMYLLNSLLPLAYGDDYLFQFVWDEEHGGYMYRALPEDAKRVEGLGDILSSVWAYYFTWGGRILACFFVYLFLWLGKPVFDLVNTMIFLLLVLEIYWLGHGGRISFPEKPWRIAWIFFALWSFCVGFSGDVFWITGTCHYLWMIVFLLAFLFPYVRRHEGIKESFSAAGMFFLGILGGCTNENTVCWVILFLGLHLYGCYRQGKMQRWMLWGFLGLAIGYGLMMAAPGNFAREAVEASLGMPTGWNMRSEKFLTFCFILLVQLLLWHYLWKSWRELKKIEISEEISKKKESCKFFFMSSFFSLFIMLASPAFPIRAGFGPTIFLVLSCAIMQEIMQKTGHALPEKLSRMLRFLGVCYMAVTMAVTVQGFFAMHDYGRYVDSEVQAALSEGRTKEILVVRPFDFSEEKNWMSGLHLGTLQMTDSEKSWYNVAYARYWGILGIRAESCK